MKGGGVKCRGRGRAAAAGERRDRSRSTAEAHQSTPEHTTPHRNQPATRCIPGAARVAVRDYARKGDLAVALEGLAEPVLLRLEGQVPDVELPVLVGLVVGAWGQYGMVG